MGRLKLFITLAALLIAADQSIAARQALNENASPSSKGGLNSNFSKANANFIETYAALDLKSNISCFASEASFNGCFGLEWQSIDASGFNGNLATTDNTLQEIAQKVDDLVLGSGTTYTAGSNITISPENVISATGTLSGTVDWDSVTDKPTETAISASIVAGLFTGTGDCLGSNGEKVVCGGSGGYTNLSEFVGQTAWRLFYSDGSGDVQELALGSSGTVLKSNGASAAPSFQTDATAAGAGYVSTPPTYSDSACTAGQYASSTSPLRLYSCLGNKWVYTDSTGLVDWTNLTPVAPTLTSRVIGTNGTTLTLTGSASLSVGAGGNGGFDVDCSTAGNGITATYASGAPGGNLVYTLGTTVSSGDTCDLDYTQPGNGIEATTGGADLASITSGAITNNSMQSSTDAQITAYFSADVNTNGQAMTKGSGVTANTADFTVVTAQVGNGLQNGTNYYQFQVPTASNVTATTGTMGFYWRASSIAGSSVIIDGGTGFTLVVSATTLRWNYKTSSQDMTIAVNTWYYIELAWDGPNNVMAYRVNGGSWTQVAATGTTPTIAAQLAFGNAAGNAATQIFDQIMFSSVYQKNLYAVRTSTNP